MPATTKASNPPSGRALRGGRDDFFTAKDTARLVAHRVSAFVRPGDVVLDPSAGDGRLLRALGRVLPFKVKRVQADIHPCAKNVKKKCFLSERPAQADVLFTNPPFGHVGSDALRFVRAAVDLNPRVIALILPRSFRKKSRLKHLAPGYEIVWNEVLPAHSFVRPGSEKEPYDVGAFFVVWQKCGNHVEQRLFTFAKKKGADTLQVRAFGSKCGHVVEPPKKTTPSTTYFLAPKAKNGKAPLRRVLDKAALSAESTSLDSTTNAKSLSRQELSRHVSEAAALPFFDGRKAWRLSVAGKLKFGGIPEAALSEMLRDDGRCVGLLSEALVTHTFQNVFPAPKQDKLANYDVVSITSTGKSLRWDVRVFNRNGCLFVPASVRTGLKKFTTKDFKAKLAGLAGFILVDTRKFPTVRFLPISAEAILACARKGAKTEADLKNLRSATLKRRAAAEGRSPPTRKAKKREA